VMKLEHHGSKLENYNRIGLEIDIEARSSGIDQEECLRDNGRRKMPCTEVAMKERWGSVNNNCEKI
jgi:hypothetical protein